MVYLFAGLGELLLSPKAEYHLSDILGFIFLKNFWKYTNWYVFEIIMFYFLFWFIYRKAKLETANIIILCVSIVFIITLHFAGADNPWYGSTLCFPMGLIYAQNERRINELLNKKYVLAIVICSLFLIASITAFFILDDRGFLGNAIARNVAAVVFSILLILVTIRFEVGNRLSAYLGTLAYEIFLIHPWILRWIKIENDVVYTMVCVLLTVFLSVLLHKLLEILQLVYRHICKTIC